MSHMDVSATMQAIASALTTANVVSRCLAYPGPTVGKRQAAVGYPEQVEFDVTFARGLEQATFPVWVVCGDPRDESTREVVSGYIAGTADVKDALDGDLSGTVSSLRVVDARLETYPTVDGDFIAVRFDCEVLS